MLSLLFLALLPSAEVSDTLQGATILADRGVVVSQADTVSLENVSSAEELVYLLPSLGLGDYGGYAGLKTVSLRGLGSAHTAVYVDGIKVSNVQSGQADLGFLDLHGLDDVVVDFAQNSLNFRSRRPEFDDNPVNGRVLVDAGSFGTVMPAARINWRISERLSASANFGALWTAGNYPCEDGTIRQNNDMRRISGGADLFGVLNEGDFHIKAYLNDSDRGTPGSTTYPSSDRQADDNAFVQGSLNKAFGELYSLSLSAKASRDNLYYFSSWGDSDYHQNSWQLAGTHIFNIGKMFRATLNLGGSGDALKSNSYNAVRNTVNAGAGAALRAGRFSAELGLQYDMYFDVSQLSRHALQPSAQLRFVLAEGLHIGGYARRAYRVPTFNELYYVGYGNPELKPEDAILAGAGVELKRRFQHAYTISANAGCFYNRLRDKIVSAPSDDPYVWLPYNVGLSRSTGADISAGLRHDGRFAWGFEVKYSWQDAVDLTPDSSSYGTRLPYAAKHAVNLNADAACRGWTVRLDLTGRYGRNDSYGQMPGWTTVNLALGKDFRIGKKLVCSLHAKVQNLLDERYEAVRYYPLPGRSVLFGAGIKF